MSQKTYIANSEGQDLKKHSIGVAIMSEFCARTLGMPEKPQLQLALTVNRLTDE